MENKVCDPLGTPVIIEIPGPIFKSEGKKVITQDHVIKTIEQPDQLIQVCTPELARYYFKVIDADTALLIGAHYRQNRWTTKELFENPTRLFMVNLLKYGIRLL